MRALSGVRPPLPSGVAVAWIFIGQLGMSPVKGQGIAVVVLLGRIVIARWILGPVTDAPRNWEALRSEERGVETLAVS